MTYTPPRTFSVGFEEEILPGVIFFTFTDPKIVVKSLNKNSDIKTDI